MKLSARHKAACATILLCSFGIIAIIVPHLLNAQETETLPLSAFLPDEFYRGTVVAHTEESVIVEIESGAYATSRVTIPQFITSYTKASDVVTVGDRVVLRKNQIADDIEWSIYDRYRIMPMLFILLIFFTAVIAFGRLRGVTSIIGLAISLAILALFIVPRILAGSDPLTITLIGAFAMTLLSIYTAHGFSKRTSIAVLSTIITLGLSAFLAMLFVAMMRLSGSGSEHAFYLQISENGGMLNLKGLLLGGIIVGALGVLDDITTAQSAVIDELKKTDPSLSMRALYQKGISVGREHIASLVNTLVLAYAGASLPLFLLFTLNPANIPLWVIINSEFMAEEIVRTLVGSLTLVCAVPISTYCAAYFFSRTASAKKENAV